MVTILIYILCAATVPFGYPTIMCPSIPTRVQFYGVTLIFSWLLFITLAFYLYDHIHLGQLFGLTPQDLVCIRQLDYFCHWLVDMDLFRSYCHGRVVEFGGYVPGWDHSAHTVISCLPFTQILGEIEVVILVCKKILNPIHVPSFAGFFLHSLQVSR